MTSKLSPSIMCVDFFDLENSVKEFEQNDIEYIHVDIMDGKFVGNYTLGTDFIKSLKAKCSIPLDIHLMIENPENKLDWFAFGENDYVAVHAEATCHLQKVLASIRARGAKPMVAINPGTPICMLESVLDDVDCVLVMTVNPGFAGQKLVKSTLKKIRELREYLNHNGYEHIEIEVDGNVSFENAKLMREAGANIFVGGTSSIFSKEGSMSENVARLREVTA
ncbi:MAG: ribulose-phosphate 3-epimerase [Lachnospiraceae bacterium]|nr:ribulose-phosphate 3-epimerase [Lachnospiraceae bacterium]